MIALFLQTLRDLFGLFIGIAVDDDPPVVRKRQCQALLAQQSFRIVTARAANLRAAPSAANVERRHCRGIQIGRCDLRNGGQLFSLGTLSPSLRASERPIAIACLRLFTVLPLRPDLSLPRFISCMARFTLRPAFLPYLRFLRPPLFFLRPLLVFLRPPLRLLLFLRPVLFLRPLVFLRPPLRFRAISVPPERYSVLGAPSMAPDDLLTNDWRSSSRNSASAGSSPLS